MKYVEELIEELKKFPPRTEVGYSIAFSDKYPFLRAQGEFTEIMYLGNRNEAVFLGDGGTNEDYTKDE